RDVDLPARQGLSAAVGVASRRRQDRGSRPRPDQAGTQARKTAPGQAGADSQRPGQACHAQMTRWHLGAGAVLLLLVAPPIVLAASGLTAGQVWSTWHDA